MFFEMNPRFVRDMELMLEAEGFADVEIRKDQFGKERMIKGILK